jgi:molecular chaperone GrpE
MQNNAQTTPEPKTSEATAPETGPGATAAAAEAQPAPDLSEQLSKAQEEAARHKEAWLRAAAEAENIRKRTQQEIGNARKFALEGFAAELLPVRDSLESALAAENASLEQMRSGVELTLRQLTQAIEKFGIIEIAPVQGEKFDPHRHQAMTLVESAAEPNTVVHLMQKGYALNDRVLRPALVTVAKAPEKAS